MGKKILIGVAVLILLLVGLSYTLLTNADSLIVAAVEKYGTQVAKAPVKLASAQFTLADGRAVLKGLTIGNPKGFSNGKAFQLDEITIEIDPATLAGDAPLVIKEISIQKPQVIFEGAADGSSNLGVIADNAKAFANNISPSTQSEGQKPSGSGERKMVVEKLEIENGQITGSHALLKDKTISLPLPTIRVLNLGKDEAGITAPQLAQMILSRLSIVSAQTATSAVTQQIKEVAKEIGNDAVDNLKDKVIDMLPH